MTDRITGGEAVYRVLRDQGVGTVFALLGGSMLELYDSIREGGDIAYVGARDERGGRAYGRRPCAHHRRSRHRAGRAGRTGRG